MLFYVVSLMRKFADKSFELVLDLTMSTASNDPEVCYTTLVYTYNTWKILLCVM